MTRAREAAIWRKMGRGFERVGDTERHRRYSFNQRHHPFNLGICYAARQYGLNSHYPPARVLSWHNHGDPLSNDSRLRRAYAYHRAMTCYLMAEMVENGCAPGKGP